MSNMFWNSFPPNFKLGTFHIKSHTSSFSKTTTTDPATLELYSHMVTRASESPYNTFVQIRRYPFLKTLYRKYLHLWCEWHILWNSVFVQCTTFITVLSDPDKTICRSWGVTIPLQRHELSTFPSPHYSPLSWSWPISKLTDITCPLKVFKFGPLTSHFTVICKGEETHPRWLVS